MQIEFGLPNGAGGMAAHHGAEQLKSRLKDWQAQHSITVDISSTRHDHRHWLVVTFNTEQALTLFALTFDDTSFMGWRRILAD